jgi:hypothetical protein
VKINEWFKKHKPDGSLNSVEYENLEKHILAFLETAYTSRVYSYTTEQIINSVLNQAKFKRMFSRRTNEDILEIKKQFKDYVEKKYQNKKIPVKEINKLDRALFNIVLKH